LLFSPANFNKVIQPKSFSSAVLAFSVTSALKTKEIRQINVNDNKFFIIKILLFEIYKQSELKNCMAEEI
jgi:hypothetical protein